MEEDSSKAQAANDMAAREDASRRGKATGTEDRRRRTGKAEEAWRHELHGKTRDATQASTTADAQLGGPGV